MKELLSIHVPKENLEFFELETVLNKAEYWELVLIERENLLPEALCNPISVLTQSFSMKKIFIVIKRRRWKEKGSDIHFSYSYELHEKLD